MNELEMLLKEVRELKSEIQSIKQTTKPKSKEKEILSKIDWDNEIVLGSTELWDYYTVREWYGKACTLKDIKNEEPVKNLLGLGFNLTQSIINQTYKRILKQLQKEKIKELKDLGEL